MERRERAECVLKLDDGKEMVTTEAGDMMKSQHVRWLEPSHCKYKDLEIPTSKATFQVNTAPKDSQQLDPLY